MKIAYTMTTGRGDLDPVLADLAHRLHEDGVKTCGAVQVNTDRSDGHRCDMDVRVLPDGPVIRISQFLGKEAKGCRLDPDALELAVCEVSNRMTKACDVLVLNKYGKHEAEGRGFRDVIADALQLGVPVIVGVNPMNREAFEKFSGGLAEFVAPEVNALLNWLGKGSDARLDKARQIRPLL